MMEENPYPPGRRRSGLTVVVVSAVLAVVAAAIYFPTGRHRVPGSSAPRHALPFGAAEQAYAARVRFGDFGISRAENYLHQEVTTLSVDVTNAGDRPLREIEVTLEFRDALNQVVLRETRKILNASVPPLAVGEKRTFEISFEHLPADWNMRAPAIRVTGLRFA